MAADNTSLGKFILDGIAPAPRGMPQIEVTFDIDANGIINVTAKDKGTGKEQKITIASSNKLTQEEIDAAIRDAEKFADADKKKEEIITARNDAEALVYRVRKSMDDLGEKLTQEERATVEPALKDLETAAKGEDIEDIKKKTEALNKAMEPIAKKIYENASPEEQQAAQDAARAYQQQAQQQQGQQAGSSKKDDDGVVDADYKIVDE